MKDQSASGILATAIDKIKDMVDRQTIIGDPIDAGDGIRVIPISKVTYGFASGGSDFPSKSNWWIWDSVFGKAKVVIAPDSKKLPLSTQSESKIESIICLKISFDSFAVYVMIERYLFLSGRFTHKAQESHKTLLK